MTWDRPQKNEVRRWVFQYGRPIFRYLCLPGDDIACIREGMSQRRITERTEIIAVERDHDIAGYITDQLEKLGNSYRIHDGELHSLCYTECVDFAYFDLMGKLNIPLANWLANLSLRKRSQIVITVQSHKVRSPGKLMEAVGSANRQFIVPPYAYNGTEYSLDNETAQDMAYLLKMIFAGHIFDFQGHQIHADTKKSPMLTFKLGNFQRVKRGTMPPSPSYSELFRQGI